MIIFLRVKKDLSYGGDPTRFGTSLGIHLLLPYSATTYHLLLLPTIYYYHFYFNILLKSISRSRNRYRFQLPLRHLSVTDTVPVTWLPLRTRGRPSDVQVITHGLRLLLALLLLNWLLGLFGHTLYPTSYSTRNPRTSASSSLHLS